MENETKGMLLGLLGVSAFGLTLPITKIIVPYLDPIFIGLGRAVLASFVAASLLLVTRQRLPSRQQIPQLMVVVLGVIVGFPVFSSWAMQHVPASHGGVVLGILPLATAIVGVFIGHERPSIAFWLVSIMGSALVIAYALIQGAGEFNIADLALLAAVLLAALGYAVGAKLTKDMGGWQVICWALVLSFPFIIIPAIKTAPQSLAGLSTVSYLSFLYLALVSQLFAFFVWYKGLALGGIARVSQAQLIQPFITLFASALFLGEVIDAATLVFVVLIVASVWLGKMMPIRRKVE